MKALEAFVGGLAGACAVTLIHETVRKLDPDAPRMDILGMRAISKGMEKVGEEPPADDDKLHTMALVGDIISNSLYYSFAGTGKNAFTRGALLGATAGLGAVFLPGPMGLGEAPSNRTQKTKAMAIGLYFIGGLAAAAVGSLFSDKE